ncbi:MAG: dephospho-CoA kinase [Clostridia bacterium]|nr:dephospho-CoA kinase [Clostridia bacterium]
MKIIGVTGGSGVGKTTVCAELKKCGAEIIDADKISKEITRKGSLALAEIAEAFGNEFILPSGELDRKSLGEMVFLDEKSLELLNKITHKHIFAEMEKQIKKATAEVVVLDVPLLFGTDFPFSCDLTVAVIADREERIRRIVARDGITREMAEARIKNQMSNDEYREWADVCFENDGNIEKIRVFAKEICKN